jgi:hypothetical protein
LDKKTCSSCSESIRMSALFILFAFFSFSLGDVVEVVWTGSCNSNSGFGFSFVSYNGGEEFKPDGKNGAMVPCDEYFEISFSFVDTATGHVISFPAATSGIYSVLKTYNVNGVIVVQMTPEVGSWGNGYLSTTATDTVTGQPYTFTCTNGKGSVYFRTNYYLAATNNVVPATSPTNYLRELDTVLDSGNWNPAGNVTEPFPAYQQSMQLGVSVCNGAAQTSITYPFPAFGTSTPVQTTANGQQTSANGQQTSANGQQTSANGQQTSIYGQPTYYQPTNVHSEGFVMQVSAMIIFAIVLLLL